MALFVLIAWMIIGCATGPKIVNHSFEFDAVNDSKGFEVLAYSYARDGKSIVGSENAIRQFGSAHQGTGFNGPVPVGDTLSVTWRDTTTDETYQEIVDLRPILPRDMTRKRIYFVVNGPRLHVYVIDPSQRNDWPVVGPKKFHNEKIRQIYPSQP